MENVGQEQHRQHPSTKRATIIPGSGARARVDAPRRAHRAADAAAATNDNAASAIALDQYYTKVDVAAHLYSVFQDHFDPARYLMVEPSAGTGSFFKLLPAGSRGYDVDPKYPGIETADFLTVTIGGEQRVAIIGNPPFGKVASLAKNFFNHAAWQADIIAFILPRSFRKVSVQDCLDRAFHLIHDELVPDNAFLFLGKPYDVSAVFQIWVRRVEPRTLHGGETTHADFTFLKKAEGADFAMRRVGAKAGQVHHDMTVSPNSNYFIRGDVEAVMRQLDFASVVGNVAGSPSLAKSEIIALYRAHVQAIGNGWVAAARKG